MNTSDGQVAGSRTDSPDRLIVSIVVAYFPEGGVFELSLSALLAHTNFVVIDYNAPARVDTILQSSIDQSDAPKRCLLIMFEENAGIAKAIDAGREQRLHFPIRK